MRAGNGMLVGGHQVLHQLLAGPRAHDLDAHVTTGDPAGQPASPSVVYFTR